jgi:hypothetical protein
MGSGGKPADAFPFSSLRLLCDSFHWPNQFNYTHEWPHELYVPQGPGWSEETQGIARDGRYWYLVMTDSLWYFSEYPAARKPLPAFEEHSVTNNGVIFRGRQQLFDTDAPSGPVHLSAPALFGKLLLVPAEGNSMPGEEGLLWVWVFDTDALGFVGRFSVEVTFPGQFPWCAISQDGRLMYTSRFGDLEKDSQLVNWIYIYRLPDLTSFVTHPATGLPVKPSTQPAIKCLGDSYYPSLASELIAALWITDPGGATGFGHVQGGCVSPNGHLYISFEKVMKEGSYEDTKGVLGVDLLTGQGVRYTSSDRGNEVEGVFAGTDGIHVLHHSNRLGSDQFTISHYAADTGGV